MFFFLEIASSSSAVTEFKSYRIGAAELLVRNWPVVLGAALVFLIVLAIAFAMIKTNTCGRLRFFKGKLDEEVLINKRQSMMISRSNSRQP